MLPGCAAAGLSALGQPNLAGGRGGKQGLVATKQDKSPGGEVHDVPCKFRSTAGFHTLTPPRVVPREVGRAAGTMHRLFCF